MVKKRINNDFQKTKSISIAAALIVRLYYPKKLRNLSRRLHSGYTETTGSNSGTDCHLH